MSFVEYKKGRFKRTSLFYNIFGEEECMSGCFLERFGHVEIKQILLVGEIAS